MLRYSFVLVAGFLSAAPALAGTWAEGMFEELSKDFGSVPRGQVLTHPFTIRNTTGQTVTISGVRVSCNVCTSAAILKGQLQPGEETAVSVRMDSGKFLGVKTVYVYVTFSEPQYDEVRLWIQANSRDDVNLSPDTLAFGPIKKGDGPSKSVSVTFYGGGVSEITEVQSDSNYVQAQTGAARRNGNEVTYDLTVKLRASTPVGNWYTDVWVKTNVEGMTQIRVPLTVEVESALSVSPDLVALGPVKVNGENERRVVIRGAQPFKVTAIEGGDEEVIVKDSTDDAKQVHVLTVKIKPTKAGDVKRKIKVKTDLKEEGEVDFNVTATITP